MGINRFPESTLNPIIMSYGTLKLQDGSIMPMYEADKKTRPDVFFRGRDYLDEHGQRMWVNGFGLPEDVLPCVNDEIGRLAHALMEASFVPREMAVSVGSVPGEDYASSLTERNAAGVISAWFPKALRGLIDGLPPELQTRFTNYADVLPWQGEEPTFYTSDEIVVGGGAILSNRLDRVRLIDPDVANMLDTAFESGVAAVIERALRHIGCAMLERARLSQSSLHRDVRDSFESTGGRSKPTHYSTLDMGNCAEWIKRAISGGDNLIGVAVSLPEASREKVFGNLARARVAQEAAEATRA